MENFKLQITQFPHFSVLIPFSFHSLLILHNLSQIHLSEFFLWNFNFHVHFIQAGPLFLNSFAFVFLRLGIVQCFVFLGFLLLLENFGLETPIPVGIRVLGVKTPLRA